MTLLTVFVASLLGSLHCAAMCGGFVVAIPIAGAKLGPRGQPWALGAYHVARGTGYAILGAVAGSVGAGVEHAGLGLGRSGSAGLIAGMALVGLGIVMLGFPGRRPMLRDRVDGCTSRGLRALPRTQPSDLVVLRRSARPSRVAHLFTSLLRRGGLWAAGGLGLASALLPCGWLWSYLLVAAGTGRPFQGAVVMLVFWLGTLPLLLSVGSVAAWLGPRFGRWTPRLSAAVLLGLGVMTVTSKLPYSCGVEDEAPCHSSDHGR